MKCNACNKRIESGTLVKLEHPKEIWLCDNCRWHILYTLVKQFVMEQWMPKIELRKREGE